MGKRIQAYLMFVLVSVKENTIQASPPDDYLDSTHSFILVPFPLQKDTGPINII